MSDAPHENWHETWCLGHEPNQCLPSWDALNLGDDERVTNRATPVDSFANCQGINPATIVSSFEHQWLCWGQFTKSSKYWTTCPLHTSHTSKRSEKLMHFIFVGALHLLNQGTPPISRIAAILPSCEPPSEEIVEPAAKRIEAAAEWTHSSSVSRHWLHKNSLDMWCHTLIHSFREFLEEQIMSTQKRHATEFKSRFQENWLKKHWTSILEDVVSSWGKVGRFSRGSCATFEKPSSECQWQNMCTPI